MAQSALSRFPTEIVKAILDNLPRADLPAARFVNKRFSCAAAPRLFSIIPLWISLKSLENLTDLSIHFHLPNYVEEIVFSPLRIIDHENKSEYFMKVERALNYESNSMNSVALQLGRHRSAYHALIEAQRYLAEGKIYLRSSCAS